MESQSSDQQQFDAQVNRAGRTTLQVLAGIGIFAALIMSIIALMHATGNNGSPSVIVRNAAPAPTGATQALPSSISATIEHATVGCHTLAVQGASKSAPHVTVKLATGGVLHLEDNDVMPHTVFRVSGPQATISGADMSHMGASSTVTFPAAGTYVLSTKAGEDYVKGIKTIGRDNTLKIRVVVRGAPA
jgi:plastocyanin